ncbi:MAG: effector-associated domain EAD1-containing protein [Dehalococcoidales bacterium]|nr:effector-associated domain EAD1-containing protein [Dehalococcoidales bacterium]
MRNLELTGVTDVAKFSEVLKSWAGSLSSHATASDIADILQSWATEKATPLWQSAIGNGLESAFSNKAATDSLFTQLWLAMARVPELAGRLLSLLASAKGPEKRLLAAAPRHIQLTIAEGLLPQFVSRGWWEVAGMLLALSRPATEALMAALKLNAKGSKKALLARALSEASDHEIVVAAVSSEDAVAIQIAADACIRASEVMKAFDWTTQVWFQLLGEAASKSEDIIEALPNALAGMGQTINAQLADESVWRVVATTALADLMDVPGRERAWSLIPKAYAATIGAATARSWLLRFEEGKAVLSQLEPQLATAVQTAITTRGYLVQVLRRAPAALPLYLRDFGFASEHEAQSFLAELQKSDSILSELVAVTLGGIIKESRWTQTARDAAISLKHRPDFRPMMKECLSLLGVVDQLWVGWALGIPVHLSLDEAWSAFESETTTLYPWGPSERELWSRSGGHNEDLANEDNGRATWHRCIRELRSGKAPGTHALLNVMLEDFPYNDTLRQLQRQNFWK